MKKYNHINWALADQAMVSGVNFLTGILFVRFLGMEEFGYFTLSWMIILFVNSLQMAMVISPMMSIAPKQNDIDKPGYYGAVIIQQLVFSLISFIFIYFGVKASFYIYPEWHIQSLALPLAFTAFMFQVQDFMRRLFFSRNQCASAFLSDVISYVGQLALVVYYFYNSKINTEIILWIIGASSAASVLIGCLTIKGILLKNNTVSVFKRHWLFSKWMVASTLLQWLSGNYFVIATGSLVGAYAVGVIKSAYNIMAVSHIFFQSMENFVPATASNHYKYTGNYGLSLYINKVFISGVIASSFFAICVIFFSTDLLNVIYGTEYKKYSYILEICAISYIFMFASIPFKIGLRTLERTQGVFMALLASSIFSLLTAHFFINILYINGAMIGILISNIIIYLFSWFFFKKYNNIYS